MKKQEIETALKNVDDKLSGLSEDGKLRKIYTTIREALTQQLNSEPTASEFLSKAKAICETIPFGACKECPLDEICGSFQSMDNEADLVRKVMDYRLEDKDEANMC